MSPFLRAPLFVVPLLAALSASACSPSSTGGSSGGGDFTCGTTAAPKGVVIGDAPETPENPKFAGGDLGTGRWELESVAPTFAGPDSAKFVGKTIGLSIEFGADGHYAEAWLDSTGLVQRANGTYVVTGTSMKLTDECRPDKEPDGVRPELTVSDAGFTVDGDTLTMRGYVSSLETAPGESTGTASPMNMVLKRR